jgi:hypothetical protein
MINREFTKPSVDSEERTSSIGRRQLRPDVYAKATEADTALWDSSTTYAVGDHVMYDDILYQCIQSGSGQQPDTATTYWTALSLLKTRVIINGTAAWQDIYVDTDAPVGGDGAIGDIWLEY